MRRIYDFLDSLSMVAGRFSGRPGGNFIAHMRARICAMKLYGSRRLPTFFPQHSIDPCIESQSLLRVRAARFRCERSISAIWSCQRWRGRGRGADDFFGADRIVFASDCTFDPEGGPMFIREGIRSVEELDLSETVKRRIYETNAERLLTPLKEE